MTCAAVPTDGKERGRLQSSRWTTGSELAALLPRLPPSHQALLPSKFPKRQIAPAPTLILRHGAWSLRFTRHSSEEDLASCTH